MKKFVLTVFVVLFSLSLLAQKETTVSVLYNGNKEWTAWLDFLKKGFEEENPGYKVKLVPAPSMEADYQTKTAMMLRSSDSVDVVFIDNIPLLHSYIKGGLMAPIPELENWKGWPNFFDYTQKGVQDNGKYYGLHVSTSCIVLYYNKELFKKAGIPIPWEPKNWQEIIDAAEMIKKTSPDVYPFWFTANSAGEATTMYTALMLLYGTGETFYKDGKWYVASQGLLDSLKFIDKAFKDGITPPRDVILNKHSGSMLVDTYAPEQKVGIILEGGWLSSLWTGDKEKTKDYYGVTVMPTQFGQSPGHITVAGGWLMGINAKSKNKDAAWKFMEFTTRKDSMLEGVLLSNNTTPRKDVAEDPGYPEIMRKPTKFLEFAQFRPADENYPYVSSELRTAVEEVASGQKTPEKAMKGFADSMERTLGKDKVIRKDYK